MKPTKLYLISPREPSGATWLINCLLELGIKTYRETLGDMWEPSAHGGYTLNPTEELLKKWLPILSTRKVFHFREDIEVEWAHHWPTLKHRAHCVIYFVRDPRDALFSRYRRESPEMSFGEFLDFPDPNTLLNKIDTWNLFNEVWLQQPNLKFFRFEDYKQDAKRTLEDILRYAGIQTGEQKVISALGNSTFEKAAMAEKKYREQHPEDEELINRASQVGAWQSLDETGVATRITASTRGVLAYYGYEQQAQSGKINYLPHAEILDFLKRLPVSSDFWQPVDDAAGISANATQTMQYVLSLDDETLRRSGLPAYDIFVLLHSMEEFARGIKNLGVGNINGLRNRHIAKPWWVVTHAMDRNNIPLHRIVRTWLWKICRFLRKP